MSGHHDHHDHFIRDRHVLWTVLALNFAMFMLEIWQGMEADSSSLIADSMDFLGDSFSYGLTIYVLARPLSVRAHAAIFKAVLMLLLAAVVLWQGAQNYLNEQTPEYVTMGWVAALALMVNATSAVLLFRSRGRDSNMQSVWMCSRNDAIANLLIIVAAGLVYLTGTLWPDLAVALAIAGLEGVSALKIIASAKTELHHDKKH
jgi:Co/Zn/Cd efflux system component